MKKKKFWHPVSIGLLLLAMCTAAFGVLESREYFELAFNWDKEVDLSKCLELSNKLKKSVPFVVNTTEQNKEEFTYQTFTKQASKAKKVSLCGDFNGWKKTGIELNKNEQGLWQTRLPLAAGNYNYVYMVDDEEQLEDFSTNFTVRDGRKVSVLSVK